MTTFTQFSEMIERLLGGARCVRITVEGRHGVDSPRVIGPREEPRGDRFDFRPLVPPTRRAHAARYHAALAAAPLRLPVERAGAHHVYHQFVVRSERRDALREQLAQAGVPTLAHYPLALHEVEALRGRVVFRKTPARAAELARTIASLPIYPELPAAHQARVIEATLRLRA
jgi:hypothetical protein